MNQPSRAFETTGTLEDGLRIRLDGPIPEAPGQRVRVIVLLDEAQDMDEGAWLRTASGQAAFADLADEPELYSLADGTPFDGRSDGQADAER